VGAEGGESAWEIDCFGDGTFGVFGLLDWGMEFGMVSFMISSVFCSVRIVAMRIYSHDTQNFRVYFLFTCMPPIYHGNQEFTKLISAR